VAPAAEGSAGSVRGAFSISVNGAREDANNFLLDGAYDADPKLNGVGVTPPVDAIREFEVAASTYDASFGRNAGGQIAVVTRSGSNQFHGAAYEFFRNGGLDGSNFFAPSDQPAPAYQRNQFGATLGGPLAANRTFFFTDYEGTRLASGQTLITSVPAPAERAGDFSQSGLPVIDPTTGQPIPGGKLPQYYLNRIGLGIAALYPLPNRNGPGANFVSSASLTDGQNQFDVRLSRAFGPSGGLFARYSFVDDNLREPFAGSPGDPAVPGYGLQIPSRSQNAALGETHIFSPALINELRLAFNRVSNGDYPQGQGTSINHQLGLPELSANPRDWGLTLTSVNGFSAVGDDPTAPEHGTTNTYQAADTAAWVRGRHLMKFGVDLRLLQQNAYRDIETHGFFNFTGLLLGNPLEELLLGAPTETGGATENNPQHLRTHSYDFVATDTWRVRTNLALTLGLRYEYSSPAVDAANRANVYNPAAGSLVQLGQGGFPRGGYNPDYRNIAPRIGVAWSLGGRSTTVLRAAQPSHALCPAWECRRSAVSRSVARNRDRLRGIERHVPARFAQYQPAAAFRQPAEPRSEPELFRDRQHRVAGQLHLSQSSGTLPAAAVAGVVVARILYLREVDRPCLRVLQHHRRSELPAERLQPERGTGPLRFRRPPARYPRLRVRPAASQGPSPARRVAEFRRAYVSDRAAVHRGVAAG
jgi:hypothetical protein